MDKTHHSSIVLKRHAMYNRNDSVSVARGKIVSTIQRTLYSFVDSLVGSSNESKGNARALCSSRATNLGVITGERVIRKGLWVSAIPSGNLSSYYAVTTWGPLMGPMLCTKESRYARMRAS